MVIQTPAAISLFLGRQDSIWVSASVWEGVSLPGAIRHVVIPRLPIRPVSFQDTLLERYVRTVTGSETQGKSVIFGNIMADARRRLRQGIGRGIRSYDDQVTVWLADPRWPVTQSEFGEAQNSRAEEFSAAQIQSGEKFDEAMREIRAKSEVETTDKYKGSGQTDRAGWTYFDPSGV